MRDELFQLRRVGLFPAVGEHAGAEFHDEARGGFERVTMHAAKLEKNAAREKGESGGGLQSKLFETHPAPDLFWSTKRVEKIIAAQRDQRRQTRQVGLRFHIFDHAIFDADVLLAVVPLVFQVNEFRRADGDIQHVNAGEIIAGLLFEIRHGAAPPDFFAGNGQAQRKNVRLAGLIFHDVEFAEVEAQERDVNLPARERGAVVFNVDFRDVQKRRAAKIAANCKV